MKTLLVGTGNDLYCDDGIGVAVIKEIKKFPLPEGTKIISIGTDPFSLLNQDLPKYKKIIVIDGINAGGTTGVTYFIPGKELKLRLRPYSIHDITWVEVLEMAGFLSKTWLFAIETETLNLGEDLSPVLKKKVNYYAAKLYKLIGYSECQYDS